MKNTKPNIPVKSPDVPATAKMLYEVRDELKSDIKRVDARIDVLTGRVDHGFARVDAKFVQVDERFRQVDARFDQVDARFNQVDAKFDEVKSEIRQSKSDLEKKFDQLGERIGTKIHELRAYIEEQKSRNRYVMDGYAQVYELEMKNTERIQDLESFVSTVKGAHETSQSKG